MENLNPLRQSNFLHRVHQPEVALLDQIQQGQAGCLVLLGDGHHQPEVGLDEAALGLLAHLNGAAQYPAAGGREAIGASGGMFFVLVEKCLRFVALFDLLGELNLVVLGEQGILADIGQIEPDEILVVALNTLFRHSHTLPIIRGSPVLLSNRSTLTGQRHEQLSASKDTRLLAEVAPAENIFFLPNPHRSRRRGVIER